MVLLLYCDKMYLVPEACSTYLDKTGLECSIGICCLTVGLLLGAPGSKFVHVLILLLSNQVEKQIQGVWVVGRTGQTFSLFSQLGYFCK